MAHPFFSNLFQDPAPEFIFEITEAGIAHARPAAGMQPSFTPLKPGTLAVTPLSDNVLKPDNLAECVLSITGPPQARRRRTAVLILPDFCARSTVLSFDALPSDPQERLSLVRFRMKKSVPFDVDSAVVGYSPMPRVPGKPVDVVVVAASIEIVARYEAPFRAVGVHPGFVTTSATVCLELLQLPGVSVLARLIGRSLTVLVITAGVLRLVRCVELGSPSHDEILGVLFPTIAYVEDEMGSKPSRLLLSGFGEPIVDGSWQAELEVPVETLRSRFGNPNPYNAGLLGYLETLATAGTKVA